MSTLNAQIQGNRRNNYKEKDNKDFAIVKELDRERVGLKLDYISDNQDFAEFPNCAFRNYPYETKDKERIL